MTISVAFDDALQRSKLVVSDASRETTEIYLGENIQKDALMVEMMPPDQGRTHCVEKSPPIKQSTSYAPTALLVLDVPPAKEQPTISEQPAVTGEHSFRVLGTIQRELVGMVDSHEPMEKRTAGTTRDTPGRAIEQLILIDQPISRGQETTDAVGGPVQKQQSALTEEPSSCGPVMTPTDLRVAIQRSEAMQNHPAVGTTRAYPDIAIEQFMLVEQPTSSDRQMTYATGDHGLVAGPTSYHGGTMPIAPEYTPNIRATDISTLRKGRPVKFLLAQRESGSSVEPTPWDNIIMRIKDVSRRTTTRSRRTPRNMKHQGLRYSIRDSAIAGDSPQVTVPMIADNLTEKPTTMQETTAAETEPIALHNNSKLSSKQAISIFKVRLTPGKQKPIVIVTDSVKPTNVSQPSRSQAINHKVEGVSAVQETANGEFDPMGLEPTTHKLAPGRAEWATIYDLGRGSLLVEAIHNKEPNPTAMNLETLDKYIEVTASTEPSTPDPETIPPSLDTIIREFAPRDARSHETNPVLAETTTSPNHGTSSSLEEFSTPQFPARQEVTPLALDHQTEEASPLEITWLGPALKNSGQHIGERTLTGKLCLRDLEAIPSSLGHPIVEPACIEERISLEAKLGSQYDFMTEYPSITVGNQQAIPNRVDHGKEGIVPTLGLTLEVPTSTGIENPTGKPPLPVEKSLRNKEIIPRIVVDPISQTACAIVPSSLKWERINDDHALEEVPPMGEPHTLDGQETLVSLNRTNIASVLTEDPTQMVTAPRSINYATELLAAAGDSLLYQNATRTLDNVIENRPNPPKPSRGSEDNVARNPVLPTLRDQHAIPLNSKHLAEEPAFIFDSNLPKTMPGMPDHAIENYSSTDLPIPADRQVLSLPEHTTKQPTPPLKASPQEAALEGQVYGMEGINLTNQPLLCGLKAKPISLSNGSEESNPTGELSTTEGNPTNHDHAEEHVLRNQETILVKLESHPAEPTFAEGPTPWGRKHETQDHSQQHFPPAETPNTLVSRERKPKPISLDQATAENAFTGEAASIRQPNPRNMIPRSSNLIYGKPAITEEIISPNQQTLSIGLERASTRVSTSNQGMIAISRDMTTKSSAPIKACPSRDQQTLGALEDPLDKTTLAFILGSSLAGTMQRFHDNHDQDPAPTGNATPRNRQTTSISLGCAIGGHPLTNEPTRHPRETPISSYDAIGMAPVTGASASYNQEIKSMSLYHPTEEVSSPGVSAAWEVAQTTLEVACGESKNPTPGDLETSYTITDPANMQQPTLQDTLPTTLERPPPRENTGIQEPAHDDQKAIPITLGYAVRDAVNLNEFTAGGAMPGTMHDTKYPTTLQEPALNEPPMDPPHTTKNVPPTEEHTLWKPPIGVSSSIDEATTEKSTGQQWPMILEHITREALQSKAQTAHKTPPISPTYATTQSEENLGRSISPNLVVDHSLSQTAPSISPGIRQTPATAETMQTPPPPQMGNIDVPAMQVTSPETGSCLADDGCTPASQVITTPVSRIIICTHVAFSPS